MTRTFQALVAGALLAASLCSVAADSPKVLKKVPPEFPAEAARKGISDGVLKASLNIDATGGVTEVTIVEAQPSKARIFNEAAIEALKKWKFEGTGKAQTFELKLVFQQE